MYPNLPLPSPSRCNYRAYCAPPPPWHIQELPAAEPVKRLHVPDRCMAVLESLHGPVWLTMASELGDHFLEPGQRRYCPGPALLFLGGYMNEAATVRWVLLHPGEDAPA